ncbi:MAG: hypothetical protein LC623_04560 [Halobacteriales archaeon]|nr:hypothetical protein [Halobacteriales archaeon]
MAYLGLFLLLAPASAKHPIMGTISVTTAGLVLATSTLPERLLNRDAQRLPWLAWLEWSLTLAMAAFGFFIEGVLLQAAWTPARATLIVFPILGLVGAAAYPLLRHRGPPRPSGLSRKRPSASRKTHSPRAGRKPWPITLELRQRIQEDRAKDSLQPQANYIEWVLNQQQDLGRSKARSLVTREFQRIL